MKASRVTLGLKGARVFFGAGTSRIMIVQTQMPSGCPNPFQQGSLPALILAPLFPVPLAAGLLVTPGRTVLSYVGYKVLFPRRMVFSFPRALCTR